MKNIITIALAVLLPLSAAAQTYQSPTFNNITALGSVTANALATAADAMIGGAITSTNGGTFNTTLIDSNGVAGAASIRLTSTGSSAVTLTTAASSSSTPGTVGVFGGNYTGSSTSTLGGPAQLIGGNSTGNGGAATVQGGLTNSSNSASIGGPVMISGGGTSTSAQQPGAVNINGGAGTGGHVKGDVTFTAGNITLSPSVNLKITGLPTTDPSVTNAIWLSNGLLAQSGSSAVTLPTGTSGGIPYFNSTSTLLSTALLGAHQVMLGGGAGVAPSTSANFTYDGVAFNLDSSAGVTGGGVNIKGAGCNSANTCQAINIIGGNSTNASARGEDINITSGSGSNGSGNVNITSGSGNTGGTINLVAGTASTSVAPGPNVSITGGPTTGSFTAGGNVVLTGGAAVRNGGNIVFQSAAGSIPGNFIPNLPTTDPSQAGAVWTESGFLVLSGSGNETSGLPVTFSSTTTVAAQTIVVPIPWATGTITGVRAATGGTGTPSFSVGLLINGVSVTGCSAITVSSASDTLTTCTAANTVTAGKQVSIAISSVSGSPSQAYVTPIVSHSIN